MSTLATFNAMVDTRVPDVDAASMFPTGKRDDAVLAAVATWNRYRPQRLVATIAGSGTYDLTLPATFDLQSSTIISLEYPAGEREPEYLDGSAYSVYRSATSTAVLRLFYHTPQTGENVRLVYTGLHVVNGAGSTIDEMDEHALADLAAGVLCEWVSAYYSQASDGSLVVDSRDYKSQATEYALRAKRFRQLALEHLGIGSSTSTGSAAGGAAGVPAAGLWKDFDSTRLDGSIRLTHPQT